MSDFRPMTADDMTADDLPMVRRWLAMPPVAEWWGEPDEQYRLVDTPDGVALLMVRNAGSQ